MPMVGGASQRLPLWTLSVVVAVGLVYLLVVEYREPSPLQQNFTLIEHSTNSTHIIVTSYVDERNRTTAKGQDPDFQALVDRMWLLDEGDRASENDVVLDWGLHVNGTADVSDKPLFTYVNELLITTNPIYSALIDVYKADIFHAPVCTGEAVTEGERLRRMESFVDMATNTTVFTEAYHYLQSKGLGNATWPDFYSRLFEMWFGRYSRCKGKRGSERPLGSSGWEHVFSGELKSSIVEGHHNWVHYYLQEKAGEINYHGYYNHTSMIATVQYEWGDCLKKIGGFLLRTSPAFDFSLFTVCHVLHEAGKGLSRCQFQVDGYQLYVATATEPCRDVNSSCVATTYPVIETD